MIDYSAFLVLALLILTVPFPWLLAFGTAACAHEVGHIAAVLICGGKIRRTSFGMNGIRIETDSLQRWKTGTCIAAGPLMSLSLLLFLHRFPRLALCGLVQGSYNLLPLYPLDGWRLIRLVLSERTCYIAEVTCAASVAAFAVYLIIHFHFSAAACLCVLSFLLLRIKIPCKEREGIVQ